MRSNPLVCVKVDEVVSHFRGSSVVVLGRYEELPDTPEYVSLRLQAQVRLETRALWWQTAYVASQVRGGPDSAKAVFDPRDVGETSGRRVTCDPVGAATGFWATGCPVWGGL